MKNVCLQRKLISSFLLFLIGFCTFPSYAEDVDSLPPIIGPWSYSALRCNGIVGVWTSEAEAFSKEFELFMVQRSFLMVVLAVGVLLRE